MKQKNNFQIQENFNEDLKILQACELENFKLFKKICDDNNLTIIMPILFMLVVYCLKLKVRFLKIRFCRR